MSAVSRLEQEILILLADGEESLATLLASLIDLEFRADTPVSTVLPALDALEQRGLVRKALWTSDMPVGSRPREPKTAEVARELARYRTLEDAAAERWPFIGLWYYLTASGRAQARAGGSSPSISDQWRIVHSAERGTLVIEAATDEIARAAIQRWRRSNSELAAELHPQRIERPVEFTLRDGTRVTDGVRYVLSQGRQRGGRHA